MSKKNLTKIFVELDSKNIYTLTSSNLNFCFSINFLYQNLMDTKINFLILLYITMSIWPTKTMNSFSLLTQNQ
jgi:hypothetical protein